MPSPISAHSPTPTPSVHIPVTVPSKDAGKLGIARLGDESFAFDTSKVPDPPTVHLSKDIDRLCREWHASSLLVVDGHEIPVKYWPEFYKKASGAKPHAWQALRVEWGNWKYIAEEWDRHHDSVSFWHKFSNERGEPLLYKAILEILAKQRNANAGAFSYVKSGKTFLATKDDVIARKWQTLLKNDPDISARWQPSKRRHLLQDPGRPRRLDVAGTGVPWAHFWNLLRYYCLPTNHSVKTGLCPSCIASCSFSSRPGKSRHHNLFSGTYVTLSC
ncbi:hypothetical protein BU15DRAFT_84214 [Melanogaster broomeanus]|nr:hypothetical protein BU15DRAFT_84214 [Melanogaster broomeanus]